MRKRPELQFDLRYYFGDRLFNFEVREGRLWAIWADSRGGHSFSLALDEVEQFCQTLMSIAEEGDHGT